MRHMSMAVWVLVPLMLAMGCGAREHRATELLPTVIAGDTEAYFGPVAHRSFLIEPVDDDPSVTLSLHWIEASFSAYDRRSHPVLEESAFIAGMLIGPDASIPVLGRRHDGRTELFDAHCLLGDRFGEQTWDELIQSVSELNESDEQATPHIVQLTGTDAGSIALILSPEHAEGLFPDTVTELSLRERDMPKEVLTTRHIRLGTLEQKMTSHIRVESIRVPSAAEDDTAVSIMTVRFQDRRLEGPVAEQSPWPDRRAFVGVLSQLEQAGIEWWTGEYDDRAKAIVAESAGRSISKATFHTLIQETFGGFEDAFNATCPLLETTQIPMVMSAGPNGTSRLLGPAWTVSVPRDGTHAAFVSRLYHAALPGGTEPTTTEFRKAIISPDGSETVTTPLILEAAADATN